MPRQNNDKKNLLEEFLNIKNIKKLQEYLEID